SWTSCRAPSGAAKRLQTEAAEEKHRNRFLYTNFDDDGSYRISGRLSVDSGALIDRALDRAQDELFREANRNQEPALEESWGARRADALVQLAESALSSVGTRSGGDATQVVLHLTPDMLRASQEAGEGEQDPRCELEPGVGILSETARRLACDASLVALVEDRDGNPLEASSKTRTIPAATRRALNARDGCCRWPGCGQSRFRDAHHLLFWEDGGEHRLDNLVSLCRRHHRMVHEGGFGVKRRGDGTLSFTDPWGRELPEAPEPRAAGGSAAARQRQRGLVIDDQTCRPDWDGGPLDTYALDVIIGGHQELEAQARAGIGEGQRSPHQA
ncbi:MAG: DUF222 domain-containing protein, partial [Pseudonocardiaceae bacterium]